MTHCEICNTKFTANDYANMSAYDIAHVCTHCRKGPKYTKALKKVTDLKHEIAAVIETLKNDK